MVSGATKVAILGATSHIAKGLIRQLTLRSPASLLLFARSTQRVTEFLQAEKIPQDRVKVLPFDQLQAQQIDVIINCVGWGASSVTGASPHENVFHLTEAFDNLALNSLRVYPDCVYVNFSSGAVYGTTFAEPARPDTACDIAVNRVSPAQHYGIAKLNAEAKHRSLSSQRIIDLRVFAYFSRYIDLDGKFLMPELVRCLIEQKKLSSNPVDITRDYIGPEDLFALVALCIEKGGNAAYDVYSRQPVKKSELLVAFKTQFGLDYDLGSTNVACSPTGEKVNYFSTNRSAVALGYEPRYTSLEVLIEETRQILATADWKPK